MKQIQKYTLIAGLAVALSTPAFAANWKGGGGGGRASVGRAVVARPQISHSSAPARSFAGNAGYRASSFRASQPRVATRSPAFSRTATTRTFAASRVTRPTVNSRFAQTRVNNAAITRQTNVNASRNATAFNRGNNFGGRWVAANAHPGWNRSREYYWGNHHYRWYDGGWLIVDGGFWPYGYPYYGYGYNNYNPQPAPVSDSTAADVQSRLTQLGYYNGDVDGQIGPLSRQAIANYQSDQGLPVTGVIDQQLLQSLGLA
jgi:hypothetical protein